MIVNKQRLLRYELELNKRTSKSAQCVSRLKRTEKRRRLRYKRTNECTGIEKKQKTDALLRITLLHI